MPARATCSSPSARGSASSRRCFDDRYIRPGTAIVQIDVESRDIGRYYPVAVGIQADARETCLALLDALGGAGAAPAQPEWRAEAEKLRGQRQARLAAEAAARRASR